MDLQDYCSKYSQSHLARLLKVYPTHIHAYLHGQRRMTAEMALRLESATDGEISRSDLRPDLWPPA